MVAKKNAVALKKVSVDSTIDMRINKSDIIELMMDEEESRFETTMITLRKQHENLMEETQQNLFESFIKDNVDFIAKIEKQYNAKLTVSKRPNNSGTVEIYLTTDDNSNEFFCIRFSFPQEAANKLKEINNLYREASDKYHHFKCNNKKYRAALTRQMLQNSEEGQEILTKLKEVKAVVVLQESKNILKYKS